MSSWDSPNQPVSDTVPAEPGSDWTPPSGGVPMAARHLIGVVIAVVATPVALVAIDWAFNQLNYWLGRMTGPRPEPETYLLIAVAAVILLGVAAAGRISWLCPAVAGVLYGVVPALVLAVADLQWIYDMTGRVPDLLYDRPFSVVLLYGYIVFPVIAALLLGAAISAYRRRVPAPLSGYAR